MFFTSHIYAWDFWGVSWFCFDLKKEKKLLQFPYFPSVLRTWVRLSNKLLLELYHNKNRWKKKREGWRADSRKRQAKIKIIKFKKQTNKHKNPTDNGRKQSSAKQGRKVN